MCACLRRKRGGGIFLRNPRQMVAAYDVTQPPSPGAPDDPVSSTGVSSHNQTLVKVSGVTMR